MSLPSLLQFHPIFVSFVTISAVLCCCFKAMLFVKILTQQGLIHPLRPRGSQSGWEVRQKFSSTGGRAPWYRFSPDHFQTVKQMLAPGWAPKMLCIIVPNWRTASPDFFSWVCTQWLLSHHTCPVCSPRLCVQLTDCPFVSEGGSHHLLD